MKDLNHQLMKLCCQNRDGSFSTQATRSRILDLAANQLHELGFRHMKSTSLKPKHVDALIAHWREQGISTGTLKNRLSALRWWASKVNRESVMLRDNTAYGIGARIYVAKQSKAQTLDEGKLAQIEDQYVRMSVRLQAAFGLRREEAIKFQPGYSMQDDHIKLKSSWTKGGRARTVPITNDTQRRLLIEVNALARGGALIPPHLNYVQQLHRYEKQTQKTGLSQLHGLRHYSESRIMPSSA
jgi:site-specific recombinase XerC